MTRLHPALVVVLLGACSVDRSVLDEQVFGCRSDGDCTDGYGCQLVDATGDGFCAPIAASADACDGFVTAGELCLTECVPGGEPCAEDLACVSNDVQRGDEGYCAPVDTCTTDADCGQDACLSTVIRDFVRWVWGPHEFPVPGDLSCVPRCSEGLQCPDGTECLDSLLGGLEYCLPRCGDDQTCPLGFACFATAGTSIGICVPGVPLLSCQDDSSCLVGDCVTLGEGETTFDLCLSPCDGSVETPPCTDAPLVDGRLNVYQCVADPGSGGEYCVLRGGYLKGCDLVRQDCVDGLICEEVPDGFGGVTAACLRRCRWQAGAPNQDPDGVCAEGAFCAPFSQLVGPEFPDSCAFDLDDGTACLFDDQCASGACHLEMELVCSDQAGVGCCGPP